MKQFRKLPLWLVIFITFVFVLTWVYLSYLTFIQTFAGIAFWLLITASFLLPVAIIWLIYLKIL